MNDKDLYLIDDPYRKIDPNQFLYDFQLKAIDKMFSGCILNGGTGSGKSLTSLYYYMKTYGGWYDKNGYKKMKKPKDLYIITTAKKKNDCEWEGELAKILLSKDPSKNTYYPKMKIVIDSWQCIKKYANVKDSFFIFDEDKVQGNGVWVKAFLKIAKFNEWVILSATPGDKWEDYSAVFIANGFYRNITDFRNEHFVYARFSKYPIVERYINERRLIRLRNKILIDMDFVRHTVQHHEDIWCGYDVKMYKEVFKTRWNPFTNEPFKQASELCYALRRIVNEDESRVVSLLEILEDHPKAIIFYNFDYELDMLKHVFFDDDGVEINEFNGFEVAEYNGHRHEPLPTGERWVYLVNYMAGAEGFNCITTDTIIFFSQTYSYKTLLQACGRIDRLNTPYKDLYYYHLKSRSSIDVAISKALREKKKFNEGHWVGKFE